jgi:hypothetical protein
MRYVFVAVFLLFAAAMYISGREYLKAKRMRGFLERMVRL